MLRAGFMGSPDFAVPSLHAVRRACDLRVVVCQPDKPAGRGRKLTPPAVKQAALEFGVPIEQPRKMKDGSLAARLQEHDLDVIVVVAFGRILQADILTLPRYGCLNVHGSILPKWRGAAPIQRSVLAGDTETGISLMAMDEGLDTGPVYRIAKTPIDPLETSGELFERLSKLGATMLEAFLGEFPDVPAPQEQEHDAATHAAMLAKDDGRVDWTQPSGVVINHIRGMDPWPVAYSYRGDDRVKLYRASPSTRGNSLTDAVPGQVLAVDAHGMHVVTGEGVVCVAEVQPPGKRRMAAHAYAAGRRWQAGECLV